MLKNTKLLLSKSPIALTLAFAMLQAPSIHAADHRDAPAVDGASEGDITDVFAFLDPKNPGQLIFAMGVNPVAVPALTHSYRFSPDFLYQFKVDRSGNFREDFVIQVRFTNNPDGTQVAHVRVGIPNAAYVGTSNLEIDDAQSRFDIPVGQTAGKVGDLQVFTGLRDDPFVIDGQFFRIIAGTQDVFRNIPSSPLGPLRGRPVRADGTSGTDLFGGFNASFIVVGIPVAWLGGSANINVWGTVSAPLAETGTFVQFERMGQPLFNTVFIPGPMKDAFNQGAPHEDVSRWGGFVPGTLTTTDNDGTGNTISGRAGLLTALGLTSAPFGAPLLLPASFANTNKDLLRVALLPDVLRLNLKLAPTDLAIGQFGLSNGRRPGDDVVDIALRLLRQLADVNLPAALKVPGSGPARANALDASDRRFFAVLQGTDFYRADNTLADLTTSGNDKPFLDVFPFLAEPHPRPGDAGTIGFPSLTAEKGSTQ